MRINDPENIATNTFDHANMPSLVYEILDNLSEPQSVSRVSNFQNRDYIKKIFNSEIYNIPRNVCEYISKFSHTICRYHKLPFTQFAIKYFDHFESQGVNNISPKDALNILKVLSKAAYQDDLIVRAETMLTSDKKGINECLLPLILAGYTEMAPTIEMLFNLIEINCYDSKDSTDNFVKQCSDYLISNMMITNSQSEAIYNNSLSCAVYLSTRLPGSFGKYLLSKTQDWAPDDDLEGFIKIRSITEERSIFARRMLELSALTPRRNLKLNIQMGVNSDYCSLENVLMSLVSAQFCKCKLENDTRSPELIPSEEYLLIESIMRHSTALPNYTLMKLLVWEKEEQRIEEVPREFTDAFVENLFNKNFNSIDQFKLTQIIQSPCSIRRKLMLIKLFEKRMNGEDSIESILSELTRECDLKTIPDLTEICLAFISESRKHSGLFVCLVENANSYLATIRTNFPINPKEILTHPLTKSISRLIRFIESKISDDLEVKSKNVKLEYISLIKSSGFIDLLEKIADLPLRDELRSISEIFSQSFKFAQNNEPSVQNKIVDILFNIASHPNETGRWALGVINKIHFADYATQKNNFLYEKILFSLKNLSLIIKQNESIYSEENISSHVAAWLDTCSFLMSSGKPVSSVLANQEILNEIIGLRSLVNSIHVTDLIEKQIERIKYSSLGEKQWLEASTHEICDKLINADDVYSSKIWFARLISSINVNKNKTDISAYIANGLNNSIRGIINNPNAKNLPALCAKIQYVLSHLYDSKDFMSNFFDSELSDTIRDHILPLRSGDGKYFYEEHDIVDWRHFFPSEFL